MLELYHAKTAVCAQKVRLVLAEKQLEWVSHEIDLSAGQQLDAAYLKLNPNGVVPTLIHDGVPIIESTLINEYLDDVFIDQPLKPEDPKGKAAMRLWTKAVDEGLHYSIGALSFAVLQRDFWRAKPPEVLDAHLASLPDPARRARQRQAIEMGIEAPMVKDAILSYRKTSIRMEKTLEHNEWLAGSEYSLADVALTPYFSRLSMLSMDELWGPRVSDWLRRIQARPNYGQGILNFFPDEQKKRFAEIGSAAWVQLRVLVV